MIREALVSLCDLYLSLNIGVLTLSVILELGIQAQLKGLRTRATFPQEIEHSQNAKSKCT